MTNELLAEIKVLKEQLQKYKDIGDELGIDLIIFFKYLSVDKVFFINDFKKVKEVIVRSIDKNGIIVFEKGYDWGECDFHLYFKDYGKTWALTKEELEKGE